MTRTSSTSLERTAVSLAGATCAAIDSHDSKMNRSQTSCRSRHPNSSCPLRSMIEILPVESIKRLSSGCPGWCSESVHAPIGKRMEFHFQGSVHLLAMYHDGSRRDGETSIDGRAHSTIRNFANKLTFVPAGHSYRERLETAAFTRLTFLYLQPAHLQSDGRTSYAPRLHFEDPIVWDTAAKLKNAIEHGRPETTPYLAALSSVLAFELSCPAQAAMHETSVNCGGLASWQERTVASYIEDHLGEQVCLGTLAQLTRLSRHHFCRAFKRSFGVPPHQYHVQRRIEQARMLLADLSLSVADVGTNLGYSQASGFSVAFRKVTGWTPNEYRRHVK
jgi:AraC family transcriptional regulator